MRGKLSTQFASIFDLLQNLFIQDRARCAWWRSGWAKWLSKSGNIFCVLHPAHFCRLQSVLWL